LDAPCVSRGERTSLSQKLATLWLRPMSGSIRDYL
jgi:hypothetical protein